MNLFKRKRKYVPLQTPPPGTAPVIPDGLWIKCRSCGRAIYKRELNHLKTCPHCQGYFRLTAWERVALIADENSFAEIDKELSPANPLNYPDYDKKLQKLKEATGLNDAVICGKCTIEGNVIYLGVMDGDFIMGSMGSVLGEKITRLFEKATQERLPVIIFTVSGGARMQEGILSLMQMAKVSAAAARHSEEGLLYVTVLTDPTTGGVTASFAMLGDIILAEPGAVIGFAGRRVIEQTIKQSLPDEFQKAEFLLEHGFVDKIVPRPQLRHTLARILKLHVRT